VKKEKEKVGQQPYYLEANIFGSIYVHSGLPLSPWHGLALARLSLCRARPDTVSQRVVSCQPMGCNDSPRMGPHANFVLGQPAIVRPYTRDQAARSPHHRWLPATAAIAVHLRLRGATTTAAFHAAGCIFGPLNLRRSRLMPCADRAPPP
jgi:hypothetical protein